jgi:hypothetical protein
MQKETEPKPKKAISFVEILPREIVDGPRPETRQGRIRMKIPHWIAAEDYA